MVESLVITLREGLEAALVVGIILAYLNKTGMQNLCKYVKWGLILGVVSSIIGAMVFSAIGIDPDNKLYEGITYLISATFVTSMVIWMWRTSRNLKNDMVQKLESIVLSENSNSKSLGVLLFTSFMVFREGIETVLFITALGRGNTQVSSILGAVIGLAFATGIGLLIVYGGVKVDIRLFFKVTGIALILLSIKLLIGGILEFGDAGLISLGKLDEVFAFVAEGRSSQIISIILTTVPLLTFAYNMVKGSYKRGTFTND